MKFSFRQILASAAGAVIAALIASSFGVTGTIVGVAIGSIAATLGTAFVSQSIERGQKAVKQAVVRVPEGPTSTLLRRMGGTGAAGGATSSVDGAPAEPEPTEVVGTVGEETVQVQPAGAPVDATEHMETPPGEVASQTPVTDFLEAAAAPLPPTAVVAGAGVSRVSGAEGVARAAGTDTGPGGRRFSWKTFAGTVAIVFVLALGFVTAVELIANKATVFTPSSPGTPTTTTSTPSTTTTSTSTNQTTSSTTTSTTATTSTTTSTTAPSTTTTTNNIRSATTTSTTVAP